VARARDAVQVLALVLLAACTRLPSSWSASDAREEGAQAYLRACASCHGTDGHGTGPVAPSLRVPVPDLTGLAARHAGEFPREYVIDVIVGRRELPTHGTREMPVWNERFGSGPGHVASFYARRREELLADHLRALQR
jgi:mono/diheme cytochrome c family protein